jgi:hypothetical protein
LHILLHIPSHKMQVLDYLNPESKSYYTCPIGVYRFQDHHIPDLNYKGIERFAEIEKILATPGVRVTDVSWHQCAYAFWTPEKEHQFFNAEDTEKEFCIRRMHFINADGVEVKTSMPVYVKKIEGDTHVITVSGSHYVYN